MSGFPSGVPREIGYLSSVWPSRWWSYTDAYAESCRLRQEALRNVAPTPTGELLERLLREKEAAEAAEEARRQRRRFAWSLAALWLTLTALWILGLRVAGIVELFLS